MLISIYNGRKLIYYENNLEICTLYGEKLNPGISCDLFYASIKKCITHGQNVIEISLINHFLFLYYPTG